MSDVIPTEELEITVYPPRRQGGQQVGLTPTGVQITHVPTGLVAICVSDRSQHRNRLIAMHMIEAALTHPGFRP